MDEQRRAADKANKALIQRLTTLGCLAKEVDGVLIVICPDGTRAEAERLTKNLDPAKLDLRDKKPIQLPKGGDGQSGVGPVAARQAGLRLPPPPPPVIRLPDAVGPLLPTLNRAAARGDVGGDVDDG